MPSAASLSSVGISTPPPNALDCPKPKSSSMTRSTFGAPAGGFTSKRAGAFAFRASISFSAGYDG